MTVNNYKMINEESVSAVTATPSVELGSRRFDSGNEYVYVYNAGAATAKVGWAMFMNSSNSGYSLTITNAASQVGEPWCCVHNADIDPAYYGWGMVRGLCRVAADGSEVSFAAQTATYLACGVDGGWSQCTGSMATSNHWGQAITTCQTQGTTTPGKAWIWLRG